MPKAYQVQDPYFLKAKKEGYRARSVYKLQEIDEKFKLFRSQSSVLDLGCSPGSWLQYEAQHSRGKIIGVDLKETEEVENCQTYVGDIFSFELEQICARAGIKQFDLILSDMAPNTTGILDVDQYASVELNLRVLELIPQYLKPGGWAVMKIFRGADFNDFWFEAKKILPNIKTFKPNACRDRSYEIYCIGQRNRPE
ncbi:MAG TPA: RlmE family RNA methyltransferase [Candidatus Gracilibacteria bacterium]|nr:RlmE family RNA methyltransferase [Candidatus Gracilibacteria bacterium]